MSIRPATEQDQDVVRDLWLAMQHELETPSFLLESWEHTWEDLSRHVREGLGFVAEADGRLTGFVFGTVPRETPALLHVTDLYVAPEARRSGVARSLLHEIFGAAHERGASHVGLDVRVHNEPATALYRRLGFADEERFMTADLGTALARSEQAARPPSVASTHVQTDDELAVQRAMEQFMPRLGHSAFTEVSPPRNGWVSVVDELCDRDRGSHRRLGAELSERMGVPVVAFAVEEDTVVRFFLFERGRMVDEYLSVPTYYGGLRKADELSLSANPTLIARLTGADPARVRAVARVADSPAELPPARELVREIAGVMNIEARIDR